MKFFKLLLILSSIFLINNNGFCSAYEIKLDEHKIYRYNFNLNDSELALTRALDDGKLSLENVLSCSERHNAQAAFNGGFYHKGYRKTGIPVWLFINKTNIFAINSQQDGIYVQKDRSIHFDKLVSKITLTSNSVKNINISSINNPTTTGIKLFTQNYWTSTLTNPNEFEVIVENGVVKDINSKGNNNIPINGFVISAEHGSDIKKLSNFQIGDKLAYKLEIKTNHKKLDLSNITALISGSDFLIKDKKIPNKIVSKNNKSAFRDEPHGRTVLCQYDQKNFAVYVADHNPARIAYDIKMRDLIIPLKEQGLDRETALKMPTGQLLAMFQKTQQAEDVSIGITLPKLAKLLLKEGCINALNLDGGGSSTLVVDNKVINNPTGLQNIKVGNKNLRNVGDIFLIKKAI